MLKHLLRGGGSDIKGDSWVATLGGSKSDNGNSVAIGSDGSVYVVGYTKSAGAGGEDALITKFNSSGTLQWQKTLGRSSSDRGNSVAVGTDGSVYVYGFTYSGSERGSDCLITKFNSSGTLQWQKTLGGSNSDIGNSIAVGSDGSVYVCGNTDSADGGSKAILIAKFNSSGTLQWQKKLGGGTDRGSSVAVGTDGSVYICGTTYSGGAGLSDALIAKFNSSGTLQWQKTLGGSEYDNGNSVAVGSDGSVYVCGNTDSAGAGGDDALIAKFNSSGTLQWQKTLGGSSSDRGNSVAVGTDGSVYVVGYTKSAGAGDYDVLITKFNSSGTLQWQKTLGGSDYDRGNSVAIGSDGSVYVVGYTKSAGAGGYDVLIARITDDVINQSTVIYGNFTLQDTALTVSAASLISQTASLSVANPGMSVLTPSLTLKDANLTFTKY